jgi:hypothetical protein
MSLVGYARGTRISKEGQRFAEVGTGSVPLLNWQSIYLLHKKRKTKKGERNLSL